MFNLHIIFTTFLRQHFPFDICVHSLYLAPSSASSSPRRTGASSHTTLHGEVLAATRLTEASLSFFPSRHNNVEFLVLSHKSESLITFSYWLLASPASTGEARTAFGREKAGLQPTFLKTTPGREGQKITRNYIGSCLLKTQRERKRKRMRRERKNPTSDT